jgi:hypothetical protein
MLAMNGDPLAGAETGRQPQTEPKHEAHRRMQLERFMRRAAVKKDRCAEHRDLRNKRRCEEAPGELPEHATAYHIIRDAVQTPS